jgi:hypothetical protein
MISRKMLIAIALPIVAVATISIFVAFESATAAVLTTSGAPTRIASKEFPSGGVFTDFVTQTLSSNHIPVHRGENATINLVFEHKTQGKGQTLTLSNFHTSERNFGPSSLANTNESSFEDTIRNHPGSLVSGELDTRGFVQISPSSVVITPDSNAILTLNISIPKTVPDEWVGKEVGLSIEYDASPNAETTAKMTEKLQIQVLQ